MGLIFGLFKRLIKFSIIGLLFATILVFIPNLPPYTDFTSIELEPTQNVDALKSNGALNSPDKLFKGKLLGPEAFDLYKGEVYTSLATGEIVKLSPGGHVTFVTKLGEPCTGLNQEHKCGRPLGFQIDQKTGMMYVADAYHGIWKVDLRNDKKQLLVSPRVEIEGRKPKLINSVALAKNGDFYWTDSTSDFELKDGAYGMLSDPSGRLFHYSAAKNQSKVLLDKLWFANGVVVSPDNQFVVVAETGRHRLVKYYVDGPKKGKSEVFVAGLPGTPDNLRALPDGSGLLASLFTSFDENNPLISKSLAATPLARKFAARLQRLVEIPFEFLNTQFPHVVFEDIVYHIGHFKSIAPFTPGISGLVQLDWDGNIVASYYNNDGSLPAISDAIVFNDKLYTGAPHGQDFVGAVPAPELLKKAFASVKTPPKAETVKEVPKTAKPELPKAKPVEPKKEAPKPKVEEKKETPKKVEDKKETPKPQEKQTKPAEKVNVKPTDNAEANNARKQTEKTTKPSTATTKQPEDKPKSTTPTTDAKTPSKPEPKPKATTPIPPTQKKTDTKPKADRDIPIKEDIPSDTAKPNKEKLKVIKKEGPAEIPNPHL